MSSGMDELERIAGNLENREHEEIKPVATTRQIRNRQLREMGITPSASYHTRGLGPGDEVLAEEVQPDPFAKVRFHAVVRQVWDHGHYVLVEVAQDGQPHPKVVLLHREGPPDWGVVEFRVTKKVYLPPPANYKAEAEQERLYRRLHPDE